MTSGRNDADHAPDERDANTPLSAGSGGAGRARFWDPRFCERSALFETVAESARCFAAHRTFPMPEDIDAALSLQSGVRFVRQAPKPRRRSATRDPSKMYDTRIAREGMVPTRAGSWHDLMNALVWATFPQAKRALHARQHGLVVPPTPGVSARRPRALDTTAMIDEGGVLVATTRPEALTSEGAIGDALGEGTARAFVFGHGIYEGLVVNAPAATHAEADAGAHAPGHTRPMGAAVVLGVDALPGGLSGLSGLSGLADLDGLGVPDLRDVLGQMDGALARRLADPEVFLVPEELLRVYLPSTA